MWEGANLRLRVRKHEGYRNYDKSDFSTPKPIADSDEEIEKIWLKCHSLTEIVDPKNFKSYEELKRRFERVMDTKVGSLPSASGLIDQMEDEDEVPTKSPRVAPPKSSPVVVPDDDDEDTGSYFASLLDDDE